MADLFFWDRVYLAKLGAQSFIWWGFAFYGFMFWFTTVKAQIVVHAVFPFCKSKAASFRGFPFALGGIYFYIRQFF
jgi:hypothetical protein